MDRGSTYNPSFDVCPFPRRWVVTADGLIIFFYHISSSEGLGGYILFGMCCSFYRQETLLSLSKLEADINPQKTLLLYASLLSTVGNVLRHWFGAKWQLALAQLLDHI